MFVPLRLHARRGACAAAACGVAYLELDRRYRKPVNSLDLFGSTKEVLGQRAGQYVIGQELGKGSFSVVIEVTEKATGLQRAIKLVDKLDKGHGMDMALEELAVMRTAGGHPHIVSLIDDFDTPNAHAIVLELLEGGELFDRVCELGRFSEAEAADVVRQIALALQHLHGRGIVHRDVRPENVMYVSRDMEQPHIKLCDFGLSLRNAGHGGGLSGRYGTLAYMAPEMHLASTYGREVDAFALGVVAYVLLSGYHPFDPQGDMADDEMMRRIIEGTRSTTSIHIMPRCLPSAPHPLAGKWSCDEDDWSNVSNDAKDVVRRLLHPDPRKRATVDDVLAMAWLSRTTAERSGGGGGAKQEGDARRKLSRLTRSRALPLEVIQPASGHKRRRLKEWWRNIEEWWRARG